MLADEIGPHLDEAEAKAFAALASSKFLIFGYWASTWLHLNSLSPVRRRSPFAHLANNARAMPPPASFSKPCAVAKKAFCVPSLEEMLHYGSTIGLPREEIVNCRDHYTANGWKVGKNPAKDWQAIMRNWQRNYHRGTYSNVGQPLPMQANFANWKEAL